MPKSRSGQGPVMRLFQVQAKPGCIGDLLEKFASTSVDVVRNQPGNQGYFFGRGVSVDGDVAVFASFWKDMDAVRQRFGEGWQRSFLPEGYEALIEECTITHIDIGAGWHVRVNEQS